MNVNGLNVRFYVASYQSNEGGMTYDEFKDGAERTQVKKDGSWHNINAPAKYVETLEDGLELLNRANSQPDAHWYDWVLVCEVLQRF